MACNLVRGLMARTPAGSTFSLLATSFDMLITAGFTADVHVGAAVLRIATAETALTAAASKTKLTTGDVPGGKIARRIRRTE